MKKPELPKDYKIYTYNLDEVYRLYCGNDLVAEYDSAINCTFSLVVHGGYETGEATIDKKHAPALAQFLRWAAHSSQKPELPEGYREDEDGDLWTDEEVMPTALAYMEEDGSLAFNFTNYNASESAALFIWLKRRAK